MEYPKEGVIWPVVPDVAKPFYKGMQQHKVLIQQCIDCQTFQAPGRIVCDHCGSNQLEWVEAKGTGTIYSYVVFHRSFHPYYDDKLPYTVALVELDEGPRVMGHIETNSGQEYNVGSPVTAGYKTIDDNNELLYFQVTGGDKL